MAAVASPVSSSPPITPNKQERRMTLQAPLNIPDNFERKDRNRPPSPLRNGYTAGEEVTDDRASEDRAWSQHSHSPSPSITKFATNFAQRVGNLVGSMGSGKNGQTLPTDAELEAEAEMEREKSRREAEAIIRREEEKRRVEDGVLALLDSMPPPPPRSQTLSNPPSPASSQKDKEGWFSAVKSKLTPTKEPLTPAQQIIQETKAREKEKKKGKEGTMSDFTRDEPAFFSTPPRRIMDNSQAMTPSPKRSTDGLSQDDALLYAQFDDQGTFDVSSTLLTIARRFEKLERWTVSHVRALEERMGDVEKWLVDKEREKELEKENDVHPSADVDNNDLSELRDEMAELQGRIGELGREMAKLAASNAKALSQASARVIPPPVPPHTPLASAASAPASVPTPAPAPVPTQTPPSTGHAGRALPAIPASIGPANGSPAAAGLATPRPTPVIPPTRPSEPSSPPPSSTASITSIGSRTRLPYPTGDYTSPPGMIPTKQEIMSPTNSPPPSLTESRRRPVSIAGLPSASLSSTLTSSASGLPRQSSPPVARAVSPVNSLPAPTSSARRHMNYSPTPRKRYTVALGRPLRPPPSDDEEEMLSDKHVPKSAVEPRSVLRDSRSLDDKTNNVNDTRPTPNSAPRARAQSSYGPSTGSESLTPALAPITPLKLRVRSRSSDKLGLGISVGANGSSSSAGFVDPLVIRKQDNKVSLPKTPVTPRFTNGQRKLAVNELVAFFDGDR